MNLIISIEAGDDMERGQRLLNNPWCRIVLNGAAINVICLGGCCRTGFALQNMQFISGLQNVSCAVFGETVLTLISLQCIPVRMNEIAESGPEDVSPSSLLSLGVQYLMLWDCDLWMLNRRRRRMMTLNLLLRQSCRVLSLLRRYNQ